MRFVHSPVTSRVLARLFARRGLKHTPRAVQATCHSLFLPEVRPKLIAERYESALHLTDSPPPSPSFSSASRALFLSDRSSPLFSLFLFFCTRALVRECVYLCARARARDGVGFEGFPRVRLSRHKLPCPTVDGGGVKPSNRGVVTRSPPWPLPKGSRAYQFALTVALPRPLVASFPSG